MDNVWGIVLAAGMSTRMKKQKMLLPFNGITIVETVVKKTKKKLKENVLVVLGSDYEQILQKVINYKVKVSFNKNYHDGMLSSVIHGFNNVPENAKAAMVFLGDQPQIPVEAISIVLDAWGNEMKGIVIPTYNGKRGHPVLIETKYKNTIENLNPEKGLRELMNLFPDDIYSVECNMPEILRDIDTPQEYEKEVKLKS